MRSILATILSHIRPDHPGEWDRRPLNFTYPMRKLGEFIDVTGHIVQHSLMPNANIISEAREAGRTVTNYQPGAQQGGRRDGPGHIIVCRCCVCCFLAPGIGGTDLARAGARPKRVLCWGLGLPRGIRRGRTALTLPERVSGSTSATKKHSCAFHSPKRADVRNLPANWGLSFFHGFATPLGPGDD